MVGEGFRRADCLREEQLMTINTEGPKGDKGDTGAQGVQGVQGIPGSTGSAGVDGLPGEAGPQGVTGRAGADGINGAPGAIGPQGAAGINGTPGLPGAQGAVGPTGPIGPQGPAGSGGSLTMYRREAIGTLPAGSPYVLEVLANCDAGDQLVTGGYRASEGLRIYRNEGFLLFSPQAWVATGLRDSVSVTGDLTLHTFVYCNDITP